MKRLTYFARDFRHFYRLGYTGFETPRAIWYGWREHGYNKGFRQQYPNGWGK